MSRFTTVHNASGTVPGATDFDFDLAVPLNIVNIGKIKVVPSATVKGYNLQVFKKATRLLADLMYLTKDPKTGSTFDPSDRNGNEVLQGWVLPYEDLDGTSQIHCRIHNYDAVNRSYDTYIDYENSGGTVGTASVLTGTTSIVVNHGLSGAPSESNITAHLKTGMGAAATWWIDTVTSTQFTIHVNVDPVGTVTWAWAAHL